MESYVAEFERLAMMVPDVTERRLIVLFVEGLSEPLRGLVKALDPASLQDAIRRAFNLEDSSTKGGSTSHKAPPVVTKKLPHEITPQPTTLPPRSSKMDVCKNKL